MIKTCPWKISLHGGHSSEFCDHAQDSLVSIIENAVNAGFSIYGITEHAPRFREEDLYDEERELGWDLQTLQSIFFQYARCVDSIITEYEPRIEILKGFEAEVVPIESYREHMLSLKNKFSFDYMVGSVHYVRGIIIDYKESLFLEAVERCGGLENLGIAYYEEMQSMVNALCPEVVGHFDLVRRGYPDMHEAETPAILKSAHAALECIRDRGCILDINTAALRKGATIPYPSPCHMKMIREMNIPVCFGDDSHSAEHVGFGIDVARQYLLDHGIREIVTLKRCPGGVDKMAVSLE